MSDSLNTWPEVAYVGVTRWSDEVQKFNTDEEHYVSPQRTRDSVKYIRADIAKEREEKLIRAAIERGSSYGFNKDDFDTEERLIYEDAGLEKFDEHS